MTRPQAYLYGHLLPFKPTQLRHASNDPARIVADMLGANDNPLFDGGRLA